MNHEFKIVGKNLSPEKKEDFSKKREEIEKESLTSFQNELEKTEQAKQIIQFVNSWLEEELGKLGLKYNQIPYEKVHMFSEEGFKKTFPKEDETVKGFNSSVGREAYIKISDDADRSQIFKTVVHEMIHLASHNVYYGNAKEDKLKNYRTGYANTNYTEGNVHQHFRGFNEGVIDLMVSEMMTKKFEDISRLTGLPKEEWKDVDWYWDESEIVNSITEKISEVKGEKEEDVYTRFKKGLFTGEMMHLRDVEKAFGKGSLRIIACWDSVKDNDDFSKKEVYKKIYTYFTTKDETERDNLRKELLVIVGK